MAFYAWHRGGPDLLQTPGEDSYGGVGGRGIPRPDMDVFSSGHDRGAMYTSKQIVGPVNEPLYSKFVCGTVQDGDVIALLTLSIYRWLHSITLINRAPLEGLVLDLVKIPLLVPADEPYVFNRECALGYCKPSCQFGVADPDNAETLVGGIDMGSPIPLIEAGDPFIAESLHWYAKDPQEPELETSLIGIRVVSIPDDLRGDACTPKKDFRFDIHMAWLDNCMRTPMEEAGFC